MSNRELVIDLVSKLPEDAPIEEIIRKIEFVAGVREGLAQADRGKVISLSELQDLIKSWVPNRHNTASLGGSQSHSGIHRHA